MKALRYAHAKQLTFCVHTGRGHVTAIVANRRTSHPSVPGEHFVSAVRGEGTSPRSYTGEQFAQVVQWKALRYVRIKGGHFSTIMPKEITLIRWCYKSTQRASARRRYFITLVLRKALLLARSIKEYFATLVPKESTFLTANLVRVRTHSLYFAAHLLKPNIKCKLSLIFLEY